MNGVKKSQNNNLEKVIAKTSNVIRLTRDKYVNIKKSYTNTPLQVKIINIIVPFSLTYFFTFIRFNLSVSIIFALITFIIIFVMSRMGALIFIVLYAFSVGNVKATMNKVIGKPITYTDIVKNKEPYNCISNSLTINNDSLAQELSGGYFTYSFWIYVNGNDNYINNGNTWNNYRYNEWKSIMYRGTPINSDGDLSTLMQFPGFWLTPVLNNMVIVFQNGNLIERLEIDNIPFNTWMNYTVVVETKSVSVYINGLLDRTLSLHQNINIMNSYNLYLTSDKYISKNESASGFAGYLAELLFFNYALTPKDITQSYNYYRKIIEKYQKKKVNNNGYTIPGLITNSDYNSNNS